MIVNENWSHVDKIFNDINKKDMLQEMLVFAYNFLEQANNNEEFIRTIFIDRPEQIGL